MSTQPEHSPLRTGSLTLEKNFVFLLQPLKEIRILGSRLLRNLRHIRLAAPMYGNEKNLILLLLLLLFKRGGGRLETLSIRTEFTIE